MIGEYSYHRVMVKEKIYVPEYKPANSKKEGRSAS
jgi:hypothetical protein